MFSVMRSSGLLALLFVCPAALAQKKPLDHSVYDGWKSIRGTSLSRDGKWVLYAVTPQEGDSTVEIKSTVNNDTITFPRGSKVQFTHDSRFAVATQIPLFAETRKAKRDKVKPEDQPKNNLVIVDLSTKETKTIERVTSFELADEDSGYVLYRPEPPKPDSAAKKEEPKPAAGSDKDKPKKKADHKPGDVWVLRNLATGQEQRLENVAATKFSKNGKVLAYALSTKDGAGDGVVWHDVVQNRKKTVVTALGRYPKLALTNDGSHLAFTTDKDDYASKKPVTTLYHFHAGGDRLNKIEAPKTISGFVVSEFGPISFSESGRRLFFGTGPKSAEDKEVPDDEKVAVDVWTYKDETLPTQQLVELKREQERSYEAVHFLDSRETVQLETPTLRSVVLSDKGDADKALGIESLPYRQLMSWDGSYRDVYVVDVRTGRAEKVLTKLRGTVTIGNQGRYLAALDHATGELISIDTKTLKPVSHAKQIPVSLVDELNDVPDFADAYGFGGWTANDSSLLVYDRYDIWSVDPTGKTAPRNLTNGRSAKFEFRLIDLDADKPEVDPSDLLLNVLDERTKRGGIFRLRKGKLEQILFENKKFAGVQKAEDAETLIYTRQDITEYPDLWLTNMSFASPRKITDANPQQKDYTWATAELVEWTSLDGQPLQGILVKPENFDPTKKYPMITYFYERNSDTLHNYRTPAPSASTINVPLFASNGYLVFIPDIPYKVGYPGESAMSAIVPGVTSIVSRGYADPKRLGIQGQSWGGYQVAYLITETNMFAAAEAGAPVSNMFSAYGGIRYGSGLVRQFQYEKQQSRIDGTPWNATLRYIENSPLFFADKVKTPLMIMHNDKDGAVPYTQGIELFTALRRLNKPVWMVVYNGEDHNLVERKNRKDLSVRLGQFFDHFLKGAPMPEWMAKGIPATQKGKNMGLEIPKP
jgi:dipeptidyl aminopeptidase/acylaminoacyl peptidase